MKSWIKWTLVASAVAVLAAGGLKVAQKRKEAAAASSAAALPAPTVIVLAAGDVMTLQAVELLQGLRISGSLKATRTAVVKAKVAGELQGLTVREGDGVQQGQLLATVDTTEYLARVKQAQEQADAARAQVDIAKRQADNNRSLVTQGFISATAAETSLASLASAEASWRAAAAGVDLARKALEDTRVRAPLSGQVASRTAQNGERVAIEARILDIVDVRELELEANVPAADSVALRVGQTARLAIEGVAQPVTARIVRINPAAQAATRSVTVYLSVPAAAGLRQGLFAQGPIQVASVRELLVPVAAVRTDKPVPYVQTVHNGKIKHMPVTTGARGESAALPGESLVAIQGVAAETVVLMPSAGLLRDGTAVRLASTPAMGAAPPATGAAATATPASAVPAGQ
jgi:RND family efflux transporter MFP subunit